MVAQSIAFAYAPGEGPASEDEPLDLAAPEPRRTTVAGVQALESAVAELPEWVILRYGALYGPGTWRAPGGMLYEWVMRGDYPAGAGVSSFIHVDDAAHAAVLACDWPSGTYNIVDDEPAAASE